MIEYTPGEIARILCGKLYPSSSGEPAIVRDVIIDSRTASQIKGALFFALKGPRNDGHRFVSDLITRGVRCFVVSDPSAIVAAADFILVTDTLKALQKLAAFVRTPFGYPVIGITGSNGKTIVKEWLHHLLFENYRIVRSPKSYNSQIGVALSVLQMDHIYNLGIFEAGISQPGEMVKLTQMIRPDIGILTNIGDAHQENFQDIAQKREEKLTLFEHARMLVYCADHAGAVEISDFCQRHRVEPVSWSMTKREASIGFTAMISETHTRLTATLNGQDYAFNIPFTDLSSMENACHCFAALTALGELPASFPDRFRTLTTVEMRLEIKRGINHCLLVNDYYNSDLNSLSIALSVVNQQAQISQRRKVVILSDILQTGFSRTDLYTRVNQLLERWEIDELYGVGKEIAASAGLFSMRTVVFDDTASFEAYFQPDQFQNAAILIKGARPFAFERVAERLQQKAHQTVLEINLNALVHNLNLFRSILPPEVKLVVMVKAFSYGTGDVEIAKLLQFQNVHCLAVAVADEGVELRQAGIRLPILVMNPEEHSFRKMIEFRLEPNIYSPELMEQFAQAVVDQKESDYPVHIKLDTGMNRLGFKTEAEIDRALGFLSRGGELKVSSVFSHLAGSDDPQLDLFTREQFARFDQLAARWISFLDYPVDRHILNSAGIERFPERSMEMVRLGIGLYGISATGLPLQPIGRFISHVSVVKKVLAGETVGYSRKGIVNHDSEIAIVPVGYADGLDRKLGNERGHAFVCGKKVNIVGNICMDMVMLDVSGLGAQPGDEVEFFGSHISIQEVADVVGTIPYEVLTGISQRVRRIYLHE